MRLRNAKENILYFVLTLLCLEYVRVKYNKLEDKARKESWTKNTLFAQQNFLLKKAGLIYSVFFALVVMNFFTILTYRVTMVYTDTAFLKSNIALVLNFAVSYCVSYVVVGILLRHYITSMNNFTGFWKKLGRSAWDGTKLVVGAPIKLGISAKDKVYGGLKKTGGFFSGIFKRKNKE